MSLIRLVQIFDKPQSEGETYRGETKKVLVTYGRPAANRQPPSGPMTAGDIRRLPRIPVNANTSNERWNIYRIVKNGRIVVDEIYKIEGLYEPTGLSTYQVTSSELIVPGKDTKTYTQ